MPEHYDVHLYPNDFAAFSFANKPYAELGAGNLFQTTGAQGACDVVLYSPNHNELPSALTMAQWGKVVKLWTSRTEELRALREVAYVQVFENTGVAIGVTMPHPHGQIYAFPFLPPMVANEVNSAAEFYAHAGACLHCRVLEEELADRRRIVSENANFVAFAPFYGRFPAEVHIYARRHFGRLAEMNVRECQDLADLLSVVRRKYDNLYGFPMPLMMMVRQTPAHGEHPYYHFHIQFLPIQRSATKLKYLAGIESGAGTFLNDTRAEDEAARLRETEPRI